jgi:cellulose synthase/poly-beta-1,6-N-acetylglucosamine synthase-like glycosyltransferase
MTDIEIPIGKRTKLYRFFEILPAVLSYGFIIILIVLSFINPLWAAAYLLLFIFTTFIKSIGIAIRTFQGYNKLKKAQEVNWQQRLEEVDQVQKEHRIPPSHKEWSSTQHRANLRALLAAPHKYPSVTAIYNAVIIATYNESMAILEPTVKAVAASSFNAKKIILVIAFEERGGEAIENTVRQLQKKYSHQFYGLEIVKHPANVPHEVPGKGANLTFAGHYLNNWLKQKNIPNGNVIITTLDSDNRPHKAYLSYVAYEYVVRPDRLHLSFQPVSLFWNNIWDAPAPMRVVATGNSFWNIISSMRPHTLRNFASHSQGMEALSQMNFWSVRTVVEDGHQYWRSYFHFDGNYRVIPIYVPIYHDAVLSSTYLKTLKAQFIQLRRWAYGASDIPYVAVRLLSKKRTVPFFSGSAYFIRLLDSHVTLACVALLVAFGGWVPLLLNQEAARSIVAHELPEVISYVQRIAMIGIFISVFLAFKMLPPRPERYKRRRSLFMLLQWVLMPVTAVAYSSMAAYNAQTHLALGKYLDKFDVTDKAVKAKK